jgi:hypothetical protein
MNPVDKSAAVFFSFAELNSPSKHHRLESTLGHGDLSIYAKGWAVDASSPPALFGFIAACFVAAIGTTSGVRGEPANPNTSAIMKPMRTAESQTEAVAAYLSYLE